MYAPMIKRLGHSKKHPYKTMSDARSLSGFKHGSWSTSACRNGFWAKSQSRVGANTRKMFGFLSVSASKVGAAYRSTSRSARLLISTAQSSP